MKTTKSPENKEVTLSKKKLTQARLPFKILSDASPKAVPQHPRKRKLSTPNPEPVTKIGKISKENGITDDPIVLSDDECKEQDPQKDEKIMMNPFVKLVDTAIKKKQLRSKKKQNEKKKKGSVNSDSPATAESSECEEAMEVDNPSENLPNGNHVLNNDIANNVYSPTDEVIKSSEETDKKVTHNSISPKNLPESSDNKTGIIVLEESNDSDSKIVIDKSTADKTEENLSGNGDKNETTSDNDEVESNIDKSVEKNATDAEKPENSQESKNKSKINVLTPKRSSRSKTKQDEKSLNSSKLNESLSSAPSTPKTPKTSRSSSVSNSLGNESMNDSTASITPKQQQKKLESAKKKEEREKEKQEREKKRQQEKEERAKLKQEKEDQKKREREEKEEAKRKEKEEKEEQKRKEREEKEKQKELEKKLKEEKEDQKRKEKEEKEEQRKKEKETREEEKRKKQEALELEKQEQELKKKKAAEAFVNFFVPKQKSDKDQATIGPVSKNNMLSSFRIKSDMRLAPTVRTDLTEDKRQTLDSLIEKQSEEMLYLKSLKEGVAKPLSSGKTWPMEDKDDDVRIIEDELPPIDGAGEIMTCDSAVRENLRPKLLSFHENRRPPYWGTWRKKSAFVKPRRPFGQDGKQLDYEVDSDEEWEEEQEGESIDGSAAGSDDEQDADEYEVDNVTVTFVPHGYLSDEEATMDEEDNDNVLSLSPETQQARLKHLEDEFESEMKKPTEKLKPRLYGLLWETSDGGKPENCVDALWNYFGKLSMIMGDPTMLLKPSKEPEEGEKKKVKKRKTEGDKESPKVEKKKKAKTENKEKPNPEVKKNASDNKKNQPGINSFLKKVKSS